MGAEVAGVANPPPNVEDVETPPNPAVWPNEGVVEVCPKAGADVAGVPNVVAVGAPPPNAKFPNAAKKSSSYN